MTRSPETRWEHPDVAGLIAAMRSAPSMDAVGVEGSRASAAKRRTAPPLEDVARVDEIAVTIPNGVAVPARLYLPVVGQRLPAIVYLHAGGWILGDIDHSDHLCRRLANRSGCAVVNVAYRLAPEHPYPAAIDDAQAVVGHIRARAGDRDIDPSCLALAGESSGGQLAAALALRALRAGDDCIRSLLLLCPALDPTMSTASWGELGDGYVPPRSQMRWMWDHYLADQPAVGDDLDVLRSTDLGGHPPTTIVTAELDPLRDEAENYGRRLADAGAVVSIRREIGLVHAFSNLGGLVRAGARAFDAAARQFGADLLADQKTNHTAGQEARREVVR